MIEEWRPVARFEGLYEVSNLGRIKSLPRYRVRGGLLKGVISAIRLLRLNLTKMLPSNPKIGFLPLKRMVSVVNDTFPVLNNVGRQAFASGDFGVANTGVDVQNVVNLFDLKSPIAIQPQQIQARNTNINHRCEPYRSRMPSQSRVAA